MTFLLHRPCENMFFFNVPNKLSDWRSNFPSQSADFKITTVHSVLVQQPESLFM